MKTIHYIHDDQSIREFRMAQACVDTKESRFELRGIYFEFTATRNSITATDGRRLVHVPYYPIEQDGDAPHPESMLIQFDAMIPKGTVDLTITVDDDSVVLTAVTKRKKHLISGRVLQDAKFPDYQTILKSNRLGPDRSPCVASVGLNPTLASELYEAFKPNGSDISCEFRFQNAREPVRVLFEGTDAHIVAMPMRV